MEEMDGIEEMRCLRKGCLRNGEEEEEENGKAGGEGEEKEDDEDEDEKDEAEKGKGWRRGRKGKIGKKEKKRKGWMREMNEEKEEWEMEKEAGIGEWGSERRLEEKWRFCCWLDLASGGADGGSGVVLGSEEWTTAERDDVEIVHAQGGVDD
ncbi:uncharacterized protein MONOS_17761 [Monocercomonoides exilis]|uniref:uncharacterized protein n=1 Tax=Monocercomonoides exilis TaxID=2049356 RepID=UPI00355A7FA6|nr:hypothetical protein MONOS_17761 [Monocercomonoides exilis]